MSTVRSMPEFAMLMKSYFGIKAANKFIEPVISHLSGRIVLNIIALDAFLHEKHGEYEEEQGISMSELITKEYGVRANNFVEQML